MTRIAAALAAMATILTLGLLMLYPTTPGEPPSPLRLILSVVLIFGIATLAATFALIAHHRETH